MNTNAVVLFNGARQHSFSGKKDCLVTLNPGKNVVSIAKLEQLQDGDSVSESFIEMVLNEDIQIIDSGVEVAETKEKHDSVVKNPSNDSIVLNVSKMGAREAVGVINSEHELDAVKKHLENEQAGDNRPTVINACNIAINSLSKGNDSDA